MEVVGIYNGSGGDIDFAPANKYKEIYQNIRHIISTTKYSVPLNREFGVDADFVDKPMPVAKAMLAEEIIKAIGRYEPRAVVENVSFVEENDGVLMPKVQVSIVDAEN